MLLPYQCDKIIIKCSCFVLSLMTVLKYRIFSCCFCYVFRSLFLCFLLHDCKYFYPIWPGFVPNILPKDQIGLPHASTCTCIKHPWHAQHYSTNDMSYIIAPITCAIYVSSYDKCCYYKLLVVKALFGYVIYKNMCQRLRFWVQLTK